MIAFMMAHPFITLFMVWSICSVPKVIVRGWPKKDEWSI